MKISSPSLKTMTSIRIQIARLLQISDEQKPIIYAQVLQGTDVAGLNYWLQIVFSIGIATLGLIINSPAVVIGAMLISPLMEPIIANGLALALGDFYLGIKSVICLVSSILGSVFLSALITWILPFRTPTPEILARIQPSLLDLAVAVLSGAAGAVLVCRGGTGGGVTALPGVAVAVSLMPPLAVVGFGVGIGWDWSIIGGGGLLFLTNLVAIIFTSFLVFFAIRMDANEVRLKINQWFETHERERLYDFILETPLRKVLGKVGSLPRRISILAIFLALVSLPLGRTLLRLREEAQIRRSVSHALYQVIPRSAIFRESLEILPSSLKLQIMAVLPHGLPSDKRDQLQKVIYARTGRSVSVDIYDVATRDEMIEITGRLAPRIESALPIPTIEQSSNHLWERVRPAIELAWPSKDAPLLKCRIAFESGSKSMFVYLDYVADQDVGFLGVEAIRKVLQDRIGCKQLEVELERISQHTPIQYRSHSSSLTSESLESLKRVAAQLRRFSSVSCAIIVSSRDPQTISARDRSRAERIQKLLVEEARIPVDRLSIRSGKGAGGAIMLEILAGGLP
jgi:uncharacterized hydrophobic protein (TIGR00271 family)